MREVHTVDDVRGDFEYGRTVRDDGSVVNWVRLTDVAWDSRIGVLFDPVALLARYGRPPSRERAAALRDLMGDDWPGFVYFVHDRLAGYDLDEVSKLVLGPVATVGDPLAACRRIDWSAVMGIADPGARKRYVARLLVDPNAEPEIPAPDGAAEAALLSVIEANAEQFARCLIDPKVDNWFIGAVKRVLPTASPRDVLEALSRIKVDRRSAA